MPLIMAIGKVRKISTHPTQETIVFCVLILRRILDTLTLTVLPAASIITYSLAQNQLKGDKVHWRQLPVTQHITGVELRTHFSESRHTRTPNRCLNRHCK